MLAVAAAAAPAADPPPVFTPVVAPPPIASPAVTRWTAAPATQPPAVRPPAPNPFPQLAPTDAPVPDRTVVFQKPAGSAAVAPFPAAQTPAAQPQPGPGARGGFAPQPPAGKGFGGADGQENYRLLNDPSFATNPPVGLPRDKVFKLTSDEQLRIRIAQELAQEQYDQDMRDWEAKKKEGPKPTLDPSRQQSPETPGLGKPGEVYVTKAVREKYPFGQACLEPMYVVHRRLYFEERNAERFGWDLGYAQPLVSTMYFFKDVLLFSSKAASYPFERYESSAGKCLPGEPMPYYLYPESISLFGATVGAASFVGWAALLH